MDSLCNYGSDDELQQPQSQHKSSLNAASDWQHEQDVNYEPVTMDMSEDSNEEEYYARKYGKYSDVAEAAARRRFDPYEDDVSDAPTSPEPDPPTGCDPSNRNNGRALECDSTNQNRGSERRLPHEESERSSTNQNRDYEPSANERRVSREEGRDLTNQDRGNSRRVESEAARQYPSYYERAKRKLSGEETEDNDGDDRNSNKSSDKPASGGGFPPFKGGRERHDKDRSNRDRRSRDRSHDRDKASSKHRYRDRSRDRDRKKSHEKDRRRKRDSKSRSKSRERHDRKSSRRHRSRSRSHSRSRSSSKSRSHHSSHSSSRHRRDRDRRSRESSMGELPRPYAPYERKPNKLQILEKLGIELKVQQTPPGPGQAPHVIAVPTSKAVGASGTAGIPSLLGISTVNPITGAVGPSLLSSSGPAAAGVTPQDLIQKSIAAQVEKIKADTGIELPKYYNPMAINPTKMAEQIQKRRLLWGNKVSNATTPTSDTVTTSTKITATAPSSTQPTSNSSHSGASSKTPGTIWQGATFSGDRDGRLTSKFQRLMGIKNAGSTDVPSSSEATSATQPSKSAGGPDIIRKQEEMFSSMESQYEAARMATHTHRGLGLGFGTFAPR